MTFTLLKPNPRFDLALTLNHSAIVLEKDGKQLGTGAFIPAPGSTLEAVRLVRNPHYRARPALDEIALTIYPPNQDGRPEALIRAVEAGEVDFTTMLSRTDAGEVKGVRKAFQPSNSTASLYFNTERPELRSAEVRRALALAIDRIAVTEVSYSNALAFAATSLLPPMMGTFRDGISPDPEKARALFAQAPAPRPSRLRMLTVWAPRPYVPHPRPVAEAIARQLAVLGIQVEITTPRNSDEFFRACERGDYDMALGGWIADTPDPADFLESNLHSEHIQSPNAGRGMGHINLARFRSGAMDEALRRFRQDPTPDNRAGGAADRRPRGAAAAADVRPDGGGERVADQERRRLAPRRAALRELRHRRLSAALASLRLRYPPRGGLSARALNSFRNEFRNAAASFSESYRSDVSDIVLSEIECPADGLMRD